MRREGFDFFFYANEHDPMHVHVKKGKDFAKIDLEAMLMVSNTFKLSHRRRAMKLAQEYRRELMEAWDGYFRKR